MLRRFQLCLGLLLCVLANVSIAQPVKGEVQESKEEQIPQKIFSMYDFYVDYRKVILDAYAKIDDAKISEEERAGITAAGGGSPVYGEILFESVLFLLDYLQLTEDDVVYDLGSGLGKFIFQVYLMTPVKKAIGIELSETRWEKSNSLEKQGTKIYTNCFNFENQMRKTFGKDAIKKTPGKMFKYLNGNMLEEDISDATVIFTCSTCFSDECMHNLTNRLAEHEDGLRVLTLRHLAPHKNFHLIKTFYLPMTWSKNTPVYLYLLDSKQKPSREDDVAPFASPEEIEEEVAALQIPASTTASTETDADAKAEVAVA